MHKAKGFTLLEMMAVVAVIGVLTVLSVAGLDKAMWSSRMMGDRFNIINSINFARQRAVTKGNDVYLVFMNLDSNTVYPDVNAPQVLIYDDNDFSARANTVDLTFAQIISTTNPQRLRERFVATAQSGLRFVDHTLNAVSSCNASMFPTYLGLTPSRKAITSTCPVAYCSFCQAFTASSCVGIIRFGGDGQARILTGPAGSGGLIKLVDPRDKIHSTCIGFSEPSGMAMTIAD